MSEQRKIDKGQEYIDLLAVRDKFIKLISLS